MKIINKNINDNKALTKKSYCVCKQCLKNPKHWDHNPFNHPSVDYRLAYLETL